MLDEPGRKFVYNSGATVLLSGIIQHQTGQSAEEFISNNLFKPLVVLAKSF
jgi:CubicO group peptidase (beta-lactamase class C family)